MAWTALALPQPNLTCSRPSLSVSAAISLSASALDFWLRVYWVVSNRSAKILEAG